MGTLSRRIVKALKIIAAEGLYVFFQKSVRMLYWEIGSRYLPHLRVRNKVNRQHNQTPKDLFAKKLSSEFIGQKFNQKIVFDLIGRFKEEIVKVRQKERLCDQKWKKSL